MSAAGDRAEFFQNVRVVTQTWALGAAKPLDCHCAPRSPPTDAVTQDLEIALLGRSLDSELGSVTISHGFSFFSET